MKEQQLLRMFYALDLLSRTEGTTINEMAESLGTHRRNVYRIIETLQKMQFPVYDDRAPAEREKRWYLADEYVRKMPNISMPELKLTFTEILSLYLLKAEATVYRGTRLEAEAQAAFDKIAAYLPAAVFAQLDKIKTLFIPQSKFAKDYSGKEHIIDVLAEAMLEQKSCWVDYYAFASETTKHYRIEPLHFFESNGGIYLFVRIPKHDSIRTLAVERIETITMTAETFSYPDDFVPEKLLETAFDIVFDDPVAATVWVSADQAKYIRERKFFQNQTITENPDGSLNLEIATSGWGDLKRWLLSHGAHVKVLAPESLREEMKAEIDQMAAIYLTA